MDMVMNLITTFYFSSSSSSSSRVATMQITLPTVQSILTSKLMWMTRVDMKLDRKVHKK